MAPIFVIHGAIIHSYRKHRDISGLEIAGYNKDSISPWEESIIYDISFIILNTFHHFYNLKFIISNNVHHFYNLKLIL